MLLCTGCVLVGCATVIGWSVGVVWVLRHEQYVSLCRGVLRWCVAVCAAVHAGVVARRAGSGLLKPAEGFACMRVQKTFLHVCACLTCCCVPIVWCLCVCDGHWFLWSGGLGVAS